MSSQPKIIDNNRHSLSDSFKEIALEHDHLSIATGYWDLKGMQEVFDAIKGYKSIRLLIGREPLIPRHKAFEPEPDYPDKDFFDDLERMQPTDELKQLVKSIKELIDNKILEVKVYRKNFLHAKCYIFGDYSCDNAVGIIGSSNFTKNGLIGNTELNALESDHRIVTFTPKTDKQEVGHLFWFDQFWNDPETEDWNGQFTELLEGSPVGDLLFSPYETYIKTLYDLYSEELREEDIDKSIKGSHDLYDFQTKNVHALMRRLKKYKVAMLADSVGLGKTYTAIEVIKQYLTGEEGKNRVEIICPKSLVKQWTKELSTQGVMNLRPITLQNPNAIEEQRDLDNIASVRLFVIDESHNLKNRGGKRFMQIIEWIKDNPKAHVLLLTATPINNQLSDIVNQILIGTRGESDILKVTSVDSNLKHTVQIDFYQAIENLKKKMHQDLSRNGIIDYEHIKQTMSPILRAFVVRRTRQGIEKEYGGLNVGGTEKKFPKVVPEIKTYGFDPRVAEEIRALQSDILDIPKIYKISPMDIIEHTKNLSHPLDQIGDLEESFSEEELGKMSAVHFVYQIILLIGFVPYRWQMYQTRFYGKTRSQIKEMKIASSESKSLFLQLSIYGILRTMFLKRLESSVSAVRSSLDTYKRKLDIFERGIEMGKIVSLKDLANIEEQLMMGDEDFNLDEINLEDELTLDDVDDKKYALEAIKKDIRRERNLIDLLDRQLAILEKDDSKITAFAKLIDQLKQDSLAGSKILVFSFYADTIEYLRETLLQYTKNVTVANAAFISSKNRIDSDSAANRFSPKSKKYDLKEGETELDYLFSTDILSEGQNLQDCGILINYDLHWNPVRMIQRNGRVNRIGTEFPNVYIYNINPEAQLEEYLNLVKRLEGKINLIRNTIGTDTPVLDEKENPIEFTDSWQDIYSESLQKRIEAMEQAEKDADFLLSEDEYISDLKIFHKNEEISEKYKSRIYNIPRGKWALMPQGASRGVTRAAVLALSSLYDQDGKNSGHTFVAMDKSGNDCQRVLNLQALEWLKTNANDNKRIEDKISIEKSQIAIRTESAIGSYVDDTEAGMPVGQHAEALRIMYEQHFSEDDIEKVGKIFNTTNVLDRQSARQLVRKIVKAKRDNVSNIAYIKELVSLANAAFNLGNERPQFDHAQQLLFYVDKNE